mgnify:CR=1 FL=1
MTIRSSSPLLLLLSAALLPLRAHALLETCTVTTAPVVFGGYLVTSPAPTDATGTITVTCTAVVSIAVNYTIRLGTGSSGSYASRRMGGIAGTIAYNLYSNASRTIVWGDGSGGTGTISDGYALNLLMVSRNYTVYGRIPAQQNVAPGAYTDTLFVTVDY